MKKKCMAVGGTAKKPATMEEQLAGIRGKVRPGYQAGGPIYRSGNSFTDQQIGEPLKGIASAGMSGQVDSMLDRTKAMPGSIAPAPQPYSGSVIPGQTSQQAMRSATNFGMPPAGSAPTANSQTISTGDYSTGPRQGGFVDEYGRPRTTPAQDAAAEADARQAEIAARSKEQIDKIAGMKGLSDRQRVAAVSGIAANASQSGVGTDIAGALGVPMNQLSNRQQLRINQAQYGVDMQEDGLAQPTKRGNRRGYANGGIIDKLIRTVGRVLPESNGEKYEPGIQSRAAEDPARHGRAEAMNPRTQTASPESPPAGGFQEEAERRRKQMEEAKNYEAGGLITPVNLGQGLYQAIAQPIAEDWRQGNAAIKKVRDQYPTADSLAGINPFVAAAQVANDVAAGNVGGDTAINVAQAVPVIKGLSGMAKMLTKQAGPTIGATKFVIDMPNTVRKNVALTTGQTLGQPANAFAAGGMVRFSGKGGPRDDQIPVKVAGQEINVSNGENAVILPAKTAANPAALYAIGGIIQATNDGRKPKMGMDKGGKYASGSMPNDEWMPEGGYLRTPEGRQRVAEAIVNAPSIGGNVSFGGQQPATAQSIYAPAIDALKKGLSGEGMRPDVGIIGPRAAPVTPVPAAQPYSNEGRPSAMDNYALTPVYATTPKGIAAGVSQPSGAVVNDGMTTTQMGRGFDPTKLQMAPGYGMATNAAGKTISVGPAEYVGADGKPTSRWTDTQQYKDAIARNEADKLRLAEMQARRLGADPMAVQKASQGIAQAVQQSGLAAQQAGHAQQVQQFAIDRAAREQSLIDAWDKAGTPEQKQAIAGQLKIMRGQQDKEGQFKDAVEEVVDEKTGQVIKRPVIYNASTGQPVQQGHAQAQQSFKTADEVEAARKAGKVKSGDVVIINGRPARIN